MAEFDFDHWANLARSDPAAFFLARERAINSFIDSHSASEAERLREMQAHIDYVRATSASPSYAARQLSFMLEEHLTALRLAMGRLLDLSEELGHCLRRPGPN